MGAEYLSYVNSIATFALTFYGYIIFVLASMGSTVMRICGLQSDANNLLVTHVLEININKNAVLKHCQYSMYILQGHARSLNYAYRCSKLIYEKS